MKLTRTMPFSIATPKTVINPMAEGTDTYCPLMKSATNPPMVANGTLAMISVAYFTELNAVYNSTKMNRIVSGTITANLASARCWFSNAPPHSIQ